MASKSRSFDADPRQNSIEKSSRFPNSSGPGIIQPRLSEARRSVLPVKEGNSRRICAGALQALLLSGKRAPGILIDRWRKASKKAKARRRALRTKQNDHWANYSERIAVGRLWLVYDQPIDGGRCRHQAHAEI